MFSQIGIVSAVNSKLVEDTIQEVIRTINVTDAQAVLDDRIPVANLEGEFLVSPLATLPKTCDLIISIGGDGTLLQCAKLIFPNQVALLGVNLGRLGFLADLSAKNVNKDLEAIIQGDCALEKRVVLGCEIVRDEKIVKTCDGLNDIIVQKWNSARLITLNTYVDGKFLHSQRGDGLIVATPTGSTAYAMSGGGPILDPRIDALALVPICPHTLTNRPIVVPDNSAIEIRVATERNDRSRVTCDGNSVQEVMKGDKIRIFRHQVPINLAHPSKYDHYATLRAKLNWALDP
jgi:NAD+ kinase